MHAESIQRVIVTEFAFNDGNGHIADDGDDHADKHGIHRVDKTAGGCDGNQSRYSAGRRAQNCRGSIVPPFNQRPGQTGGRCCRIGGNKGIGGKTVGGQRAARVKSEPAEPQKSRAQNGKGQVVRTNGFVIVADSSCPVITPGPEPKFRNSHARRYRRRNPEPPIAFSQPPVPQTQCARGS